jgi:hypothetical protein
LLEFFQHAKDKDKMARPIRVDSTELDPKVYLSPEQFTDYESLEKREGTLNPSEKRYYDALRQLACLKHAFSVKVLDTYMSPDERKEAMPEDGLDSLFEPRE